MSARDTFSIAPPIGSMRWNIFASNPDLIQAGYTPATVAQQYVSAGYFQHRSTNSFDPLEYLAWNSRPDLARRYYGVGVGTLCQRRIFRASSHHLVRRAGIYSVEPQHDRGGLDPGDGVAALRQQRIFPALPHHVVQRAGVSGVGSGPDFAGRHRGDGIAALRCPRIFRASSHHLVRRAGMYGVEPRHDRGRLDPGDGVAALREQRISRALPHHLVQRAGVSGVESGPDPGGFYAVHPPCSTMSATGISSTAPPPRSTRWSISRRTTT